MNKTILFDLEHNRKRLDYYTHLRQKTAKDSALDKWIAIYSERVKKLEKQIDKLGLRTQLDSLRNRAPAAQA